MFAHVTGGEIAPEELQGYIDRANEIYGEALEGMDIEVDGEFINIRYTVSDQPFQRIRRITGYLVGTTDRFNNAKRAEEKERVKHS